jgi:amidase
MKRRDFIHASSVISASLSSLLLSCTSNKKTENESFTLEEKTISELREMMENGSLTSESITQQYINRIEEIDKDGHQLNSVIVVNPDALAIAKQRDAERSEGKLRGVLHGIPILLKDNIDTHDKMPTTGGSLALKNSFPAEDSIVAAKLREAGAVILGKTNLSEWANFRSTRSSSGWSGVGGQTKNPYALNRNPCGSSSGSGVAVSANLCAAAIGTETDGSIVCPSNANGIVGIKPTVGLVSRSGVIPISFTQDTAGPMARTVEDAAIVLSALVGVDENDSKTLEAEGKLQSDYTQFLDKDALKGARLGIATKRFGFHEQVDSVIKEALLEMKNLGAELIDVDEIFTTKGVGDAEYTVLLYEFKDGLNKYLSNINNPNVKTLKDLIQFNKDNHQTEMPYFQQEIFEMAEAKGDLNENEYLEALELCRKGSREEGIDRILNEHNLDAILAPTGGPAWTTDKVNGDHYIGGSSSAAAISGYPNITVPAGFVHGLPIGLSFFSTAFSEPKLIGYAYAFEQHTKQRKSPEFLTFV